MSSLTENSNGIQQLTYNNGSKGTIARFVPKSDDRTAIFRLQTDHAAIWSTIPSPAVARKYAEAFERLATLMEGTVH